MSEWGSPSVSQASEDVFNASQVKTILKISSPPSVTSSTRIPTRSSACGYGWIFVVSWQRVVTGHYRRYSTVATKADYLTISLDPHHLKNSPLHDLRISVALSNHPEKIPDKTISLDDPETEFVRVNVTGRSEILADIVAFVPSGLKETTFAGHSHAVMTSSITEGRPLIDIKFSLFTQRCRGAPWGKLLAPQMLYANREILRGKCDYLDMLIDNDDFAEAQGVTDDNDIPDSASMIDYNYESDSDLENDDETRSVGESGDVDEGVDPSVPEKAGPDGEAMIEPRQIAESAYKHPGKTIVLKNHAFPTWKCLLLFFYKGTIEFASMRSSKIPRVVGGDYCSPKSMYRLADELGIDILKQKAAAAIKERINEENVVQETFSKFTSMYPEIEAIQIDMLCKLYKQAKGVDEILKRISAGELPHSDRVLRRLLDHMSST